MASSVQKSIRVSKETHDILVEVRNRTGIPYSVWIGKLVDKEWEKLKKDFK